MIGVDEGLQVSMTVRHDVESVESPNCSSIFPTILFSCFLTDHRVFEILTSILSKEEVYKGKKGFDWVGCLGTLLSYWFFYCLLRLFGWSVQGLTSNQSPSTP